MKKLFIIIFCLLAIIVAAEEVKIALLQPRVAEGSDSCKPIEINMVRGELRKALGWQSDFQVLTRTDVDIMLEEHGFQQSGFVDDKQRKEVGIMTGAQYICASTITKDGSQLYIESYLVNVETGQMTNPATQLVYVQNSDYTTLQKPCNELAREMLGELTGFYTNAKVSERERVTRSSGNYIDLGLPSGTLWKKNDENNGFYTYEKSLSIYGKELPTKEQWEELKNLCQWSWISNGYKVIGPNGQCIFILARGYRECDGNKTSEYVLGGYWSSTPDGMENAWSLGFNSMGVYMASGFRCRGRSIHLIK